MKTDYYLLNKFVLRLEKKEKFEDALVFLKKSLEIDPKNELIITKMENMKIKVKFKRWLNSIFIYLFEIHFILEKMNEMYSKVLYGPTLPSNSSKHHKSRRYRYVF